MCFLASCSHSSKSEYDNCTIYIEAHLEAESKPLKISDFVNNVKFIPVNCDESFIPVGPLARYCRGFFYVIDKATQRIFKIGENGTVVSKIGSQGRAANEYLEISSFDVNPITSEVYVYDVEKNAILIYSGDGDFVRSFNLDGTKEIFRDFALFPNGNILGCCFDYGGDSIRRGIWMVDSVGHFIKQVVSVDKRIRYDLGISLPLFSRLGEDTVFIMGPVGDDAIYKIDADGNVVTRYMFDFGRQIKRKDLYHEASLPLPDYFVKKLGFSVAKRAITMYGAKGDMIYDFVYDEALDKCYVISQEKKLWVQDVPNYHGGAATDGSRYLNFCDAEHLPSEIPNPDGVDLWMVITYLK